MRLIRARRRLVQLACLAVFAMASLAGAQDGALSKKVDLYLKGADLLAATQMLSQQTGLQFVIAPSGQPFDKIDASLKGVTAEEAIQYLCRAAGAYAERDENGVYIIRRGEKPDVKLAPTPAPQPPKPRNIILKRIQLMKADPKDVYEQLTQTAVWDPGAGFRLMNKFAQETRGDFGANYGPNPTVVVGGGYQQTVYPVNKGAAQRPGDLQNPQSLENVNNGVTLPGEPAAGQLGGGGGGGGQLGGGGQPGGGGQSGQGGQLTAGQGFVPDGITKITYDPTTNSLIVEGDDEAVRRLQQAIALFDVAPQQVIIKVEFITTSQSVSKQLGIDFLYARGAVFAGNTPGSQANVGNPIFVNYSTGNVSARLRAQLLEGQGRVVNAPLVRTLNNQIALVQQQVETTIFLNQVINGPGGITQAPQPVPFTVTTQLLVRPRINGDGTVTVNLTPQIQDFGQVRRGPDGQEVPDRLSQLINVVARVRSGETIALGGLTRKSDTSSQSRFPILGDLPIIGQFFRSTSRDKNNSELIVFVTPTVIDEDGNPITP